jgi:catechol 2,3-dioxygenase-like lactoylglutathione lyase family enzyme
MKITDTMPTIFVGDMNAAVRFYTQTLGFPLIARWAAALHVIHI